MINSIIEAISISLKAEFNEKAYEMHMEEIKQGLNEPCFFISSLNPTTELSLGKRYFRQNQFVIQYFPESADEPQKECNEVAERMVWCLEYITTERKLRGTQMHHEVMDGVLSFFVNYDCFVHKVENNESMEAMIPTTNVKRR